MRGRSDAFSFGIGSSFSLLPGSSKVVSASGITARSDGSWRLSSCVRPGKNADIFRVIWCASGRGRGAAPSERASLGESSDCFPSAASRP